MSMICGCVANVRRTNKQEKTHTGCGGGCMDYIHDRFNAYTEDALLDWEHDDGMAV